MDREIVSYADNKNKMYIEPFSVRAPERLGSLDLYHSKQGFYIRKNDKKKELTHESNNNTFFIEILFNKTYYIKIR
jgi:hypothetical protein